MLVLHGFWAAHDGLCLWAEDSALPVTSASQALRSARPHPFAAPASVLTTLHAGKPAEAELLLPSLRTAPLDSPELIRAAPRPTARSAPALRRARRPLSKDSRPRVSAAAVRLLRPGHAPWPLE